MDNKHIPGMGCTCEAWNRDECACGADWRSSREVELEALLKQSKARARELWEALASLAKIEWYANFPRTDMPASEVVLKHAAHTDMEKEAERFGVEVLALAERMRQEQEGSAMNLPVMSFDEAEFLAKASGLPLVAPDPASFFLAGYEHARALIDRRLAEIDKVQQFFAHALRIAELSGVGNKTLHKAVGRFVKGWHRERDFLK